MNKNQLPDPKDSDFSGWASKDNVLCSDGRTIMHNAFKNCSGQVVPLVWNHQHDDPANVLGNVLLEYRSGQGVYCYGYLNDTESGRNAKELIKHGDICALSILANRLKERSKQVIHGVIREVSLVLAGANPEAYIDDLSIAHSYEDGGYDAILVVPNDITVRDDEMSHSEKGETVDEKDKTKEENPANEDLKKYAETWDTLTEEQKKACYVIMGIAMDMAEETENEDDEDEEEDNEEMAHSNVFDKNNDDNASRVSMNLISDTITSILKDGKRYGSMKESYLAHCEDLKDDEIQAINDVMNSAEKYGSMKKSVLAHSAEYGIDNIDYLFPEAHNLNPTPEFVSRNMDWVKDVLGKVKKSPFKVIKSQFANITEDDARAKGYIKGKYKKEEVFTLLKRQTGPTTVYKKQKLDRDDIEDITDFDVIIWVKGEMRMMLNEEIARAILVSDGRNASSDDKIKEDCIRPIWKDEDFFSIKRRLDFAKTDSDSKVASEVIDEIARARKEYKGSGNPTLYTTEDLVTEMLLLKDMNGHRIYKNVAELAQAMRVNDIVTVEVMENQTAITDGKKYTLQGIIVNMADYTVGSKNGGQINAFEDFDIDYNQQKYLMETRMSGALTRPYSAIVVETYRPTE